MEETWQQGTQLVPKFTPENRKSNQLLDFLMQQQQQQDSSRRSCFGGQTNLKGLRELVSSKIRKRGLVLFLLVVQVLKHKSHKPNYLLAHSPKINSFDSTH